MLKRWLPSLVWVSDYSQSALISDLMAAIIVTIMLIPQSLAYALLAGLPPEMGLYASILPLVAYALFGTSRTLSVGPVAVVSLMTATTIGSVAQQGTADYATAAIALALISGLILLGLGFLRFGFITNFLSHPVVSGFITASGVLIALSQLRHILGIRAHGEAAPELLMTLGSHISDTNLYTLAVGSLTWLFLFLCRSKLSLVLMRTGLSQSLAGLLSRAAPVLAIMLTIGATLAWDLESKGVAIVGQVPSGLPAFSLPNVTLSLLEQLALPALLISLIGFVESVSVGKTLGA